MRRRNHLRIRAVGGSLLVAVMLISVAPSTALGVCSKAEKFDDAVPQQANSKGGQMTWVLRTLSAPDTAAGGFAAEVLWVGTGGQQADTQWVEAGATKGFGGQNIYRFYAAHFDGSFYDEVEMPMLPVLNSTVTFTVRDYSSIIAHAYAADITQGANHNLTWFTGHDKPTVDYSGGFEVTCNTARVDRTYVSLNQFQNSTGTWVNINNGVFGSFGTGGGIAWCTSPTKYRYWINSVIATGTCG